MDRPRTPEEIARAKARKAAKIEAHRKMMRRRRITTMIVCGIFLLTMLIVIYQCTITKNKMTFEAGSQISASQYLRFSKRKAKFTNPKEFDICTPGTYKVHVKVGLKKHKVKLIVVDTQKPVIEGARDMVAYVGDNVSYRSFINYSDNSGEKNVKLDIDSSAVDLTKPGTYEVKCTATDKSGNSSEAAFPIVVIAKEFNEEELNKECDKILKTIIKDGMSKKDQVTEIYWYVRNNMSFINTSEKGDWIKAAMTGITEKKGDCYVYACLTRALLTRAGIKCMEISKIPVDNGYHSHHYWNLVDIEDGHGWYHTDPCPRRDVKERVILWTDKQVRDFSKEHDLCYNYDKKLYPDIP